MSVRILLFVAVLACSNGIAHAQGHSDHDAYGDVEAEAHGEHSGHHELDLYELGASVVNFGLWALILWFGMRKTLPEFLQQRRALVVDGIEEARRVKAEAERKHAEYDERIKNMDAELERLREDLRRSGVGERDRIVEDAKVRAEKMRAETRFLIEQQMKQLREDLTKEAIDAAVRAAEEILRRDTTAVDQERMATEYLATLRTSLTQKTGSSRT